MSSLTHSCCRCVLGGDRRCGLGERSGVLLLHMLEEKPGLEVDASEGNPFGEEVENKVGP